MNVEHEDVVCILLSFKFEGKVATWYFALDHGSIHSWDEFEMAFMENLVRKKPLLSWS